MDACTKDIVNQFKKHKQAYDEAYNAHKITKTKQIQSAQLAFETKKRQEIDIQAKAVQELDMYAKEYVNTQEQQKLRLAQTMLEKDADFNQQKLEFNLIKEKMADKLFVSNMRQNMIADCINSGSLNVYDSQFKYSNTDGKDPLVAGIDAYIEAQLNEVK